ncbi:MAG: endonuclease MutS2, partial [Bdellovibrionales bacterium]
MRELRNLDWDQILEKLATYATSEAARSTLKQTSPLASAAEAENSFARILELQAVLQGGQRGHMESLDLCGLWQQRLRKDATLKTLELKDVRHFCLETIALKEILGPYKSVWLTDLHDRLMNADEPLSAIDQIMTGEGDIRNDASETLYNLYRERSQQVKSLQNILDRLVKQHELEPVLQDRYVTNREGRWVLPVKSGMQHHFEGIIHSSSQTKQTVFMEPKEVIPLNNRIRQIDVDIEEEIERLLQQLSKYLVSQLDGFESARDILLECDIRFAQAQLSTHLNAEPCRFEANKVRLLNARHPLLVLNNPEVVANTVELDEHRRLLLLSGPNAGGKTVLLKAVGLAAHMARCGLPICAEEGSSLPFFTSLHVAVGDSQSVDAQLSTFAAHLSILNQATKAQGSSELLLIDEICGSTDPEEGSALARSFIETYAQNQVFGVITSHLSPLKMGWKDDSGVVNGSLEYDQTTGRPTYQFLMGVPGQSLAIQTARRVGVDTAVIDRALSHLSPEMKKYQQSLSEVEDIKAELRTLREEMDRNIRQAKKEKSKFMALSQKFDRDKEQMVHQAVRRAEKKIDQMIEHSKVDSVFKRHEKLESTKFELPEIIKASSKAPTTSPKIESAEDFAKAFPPGSKVYSHALGRDAVVQAAPNSRGEVTILANSMRLTVLWSQLKPP